MMPSIETLLKDFLRYRCNFCNCNCTCIPREFDEVKEKRDSAVREIVVFWGENGMVDIVVSGGSVVVGVKCFR